MAEDKEQAVIIKKYKKKSDAAHGGSWKVAYADFMTAMMAFFLLMWLLNMTSQQKKIAMSEYFQNYSIFEKGGGSAISEKEGVPGKGMLEVGRGKTAANTPEISSTQLAEKLRTQVNDKLKQYQDRIVIMDENGNVRIEIVDTEGDSFFPPGGTELNKAGKTIIRELSSVLQMLDKRLIIEGHTDSTGYAAAKGYGNWELSTERALSTRIEMEKDGVRPEQFEMVSGYADTKLFVKENPADPKNRRISIVVNYKGNSVPSQPAPPPGGQAAGNESPPAEAAPAAPAAPSNPTRAP
ncbi:MAG TPA: flagellar motor protein MotB [Deltaproteobacteria bacterium]|nr:flagellar motor protein MotB [Deltaproteobacteria bacterium]